MITNKKGRSGWYQTTLKTSLYTFDFTGFSDHIKAKIVPLALWGLLPIATADRFILLGGSYND